MLLYGKKGRGCTRDVINTQISDWDFLLSSIKLPGRNSKNTEKAFLNITTTTGGVMKYCHLIGTWKTEKLDKSWQCLFKVPLRPNHVFFVFNMFLELINDNQGVFFPIQLFSGAF